MLRKLSAILFALAFIAFALYIARVGRDVVSGSTLILISQISGGLAIALNFFDSGRAASNSLLYNISFWGGSILVFIGLIAKRMHLPYSTFILLAGLLTIGASFVVRQFPSKASDREDLLDD